MKVVIIEDEKILAEELAFNLKKVDGNIEIVMFLSSVEEALAFFDLDRDVDLIFSDIQLTDGLSFEIFNKRVINTPVIFCTAYDEYALEAFHSNGVDYILKPFSQESLKKSLEKFYWLKRSVVRANSNDSTDTHSQNVIIVKYRNLILPINLKEIALAYIEHEIVYIYTFKNQSYVIDKTLEELFIILGNEFFRVNRQFLLNKKSVAEIIKAEHRKLDVILNISFNRKITVSKNRVRNFVTWIEM
jgi:two-component system response regulator LytT